MSRQHVYKQKAKVEEYAAGLDALPPSGVTVTIDKRVLNRMILSLLLDCQSPYSGVQRFMENIFGISVSTGTISGVATEASKGAQAFDDGIDLSGIKQGANDEIFQHGTPIMTGVDPESTYTYLLEEAEDRTSETWSTYMGVLKEQGLNLEVSINDSGAGLMSGIPQAFPDIQMQSDTFHASYGLGIEVSKLERKAKKLISDEYDLQAKLACPKPRAKNKDALEKLIPLQKDAVRLYDSIYILLVWLKEMLSFSGYSLSDSLELSYWILDEMEALCINTPGMMKEVAKVRKMLPSLLSFISRLETGFSVAASETGIPIEAFHLMYRQLSYGAGSTHDCAAQCELVNMLGADYGAAQNAFDSVLSRTKKASSLVENLNGRIRSFIEVKRTIPTRFLVLLKVYFNTRPYLRSRCSERLHKSPLELLMNSPQPDFFEAIGF